MPRPNVFPVDTTLYHTATGEKRLFPAGETDPGNAWADKPGGEAPGKKTNTQALEDLISAQDTIEGLQAHAATQAVSLDQVSAERDEANGKVADLNQKVVDAEEGRKAAEGYHAEAAKARDQAAERAQLAEAGLAKARERVTELETDIANATTRAETAEAALAAIDKAGGSKKKVDA